MRRENRFARAPPRQSSQPIRRPGERPQRPAIINPDDLKDLDELDHDCEDGWAGQYFLELCYLLHRPPVRGQISCYEIGKTTKMGRMVITLHLINVFTEAIVYDYYY